jgi:hypothetical protein
VVVKLINTDGMAFIGPGSEWFWTAVSGVILAVTFIAIYRQLRIQSNTAAIQQMDAIVQEWRYESSTRHTLAIRIALRDGVAPEKLPYGAASVIGDFWEGIAYLVRAGHIDRKLLYESLGSGPRWWWAALSLWAESVRSETGQRGLLEHFEWLAGEMASMDRKAGASVVYDDPYIAGTLNRAIENDEDRLRVAEELRAVIVRPMSPGTPSTSSPAADTAPASSPV